MGGYDEGELRTADSERRPVDREQCAVEQGLGSSETGAREYEAESTDDESLITGNCELRTDYSSLISVYWKKP